MAEHTVHVTYHDPKKDSYIGSGHNVDGAFSHDSEMRRVRKDRLAIVTVKANSKKEAINKAGNAMSKRGMKVQSIVHKSVNEAFTAVPFHKRKEPTFDPPAPKAKKGERIEPTFDAPAPKPSAASKNHTEHAPGEVRMAITRHVTMVRNTTGLPKSEYKVHKVERDGSKTEIFSSHHLENIHKFVLGGVKHILAQDPNATVHVHDKAQSGYSKFLTTPRIGGKPIPNVPHHTVSESKEPAEMADKYSPKKLKDILPPRPSKKWNELDGNTDDEQKIVADFRKNAVLHPDPAGNGDEVFKASNIVHNGKPVLPGDDEKKYAEHNGKVKNVESYSPRSALAVKMFEAAPLHTRPVPIRSSHLDMHWATQHVAPQGSKIEHHSDKVVIHHPDGSSHHIYDGQKFQGDVKYGSGGNATKKNSGKYTVVRHADNGMGMRHPQFVSQKKAPGSGYTRTTTDESKAKEFHSVAHAQNHINYHSAHDSDYAHYTVHQKRDPNQIKASKEKSQEHAAKWRDAISKAHKQGVDPHSHPEVMKARMKYMGSLHPSRR